MIDDGLDDHIKKIELASAFAGAEFEDSDDPTFNLPKDMVKIYHWLKELKSFRDNHCPHVVIPTKNEVVDGGYMCIKCGLLMEEYIGPCLKPEQVPTPRLPGMMNINSNKLTTDGQ